MSGEENRPYDAVIVGGGFAGLSAAALLGRQGKRVLLFERAGRLGGRAGYYERDGFVWQYGQHSHRLERNGTAARVFDRIGEPLDFIDTRGSASHLYFDGKLYPRPEGPLQFLTTPLMPFGARLDFLRFYRRLLKLNPADWYDVTLLDCYRKWSGNAHVERFLSFLGFTVMLPNPGLVSAGEVIQFLQRAQKAPVKQGEPRGGSKQLIDKLRRVVEQTGGRIAVAEPVQRIEIENGAAVGVRTARGLYPAYRVIYAAPLFRLFGLVDKGLFKSEFAEYVSNIEPSRGLSIDFVFNERVTDMTGGIVGVDVPLWVKFQSNIDPSIAPKGHYVQTWAMLLERGAPMDEEHLLHTESRLRRILCEVLPGALDCIVQQRKIYIPVVNGNILTPAQSYPHRPAIVSEDVRNLYFIGDTTRATGCSGDIAFQSALDLEAQLANE